MTFQIDSALKAAQWERVKGELRALVAMQGSYSSHEMPGETSSTMARFVMLDKRVQVFIKDIEDEGLHE